MRRTPGGAALAELVVACVLAAVVSAAAAAAMVGAERYARRVTASSEARRTLSEAELTLAAELRSAAADSLRLVGDTAAEFLGLVGTSAACVATGRLLVLPPALSTAVLPVTVWRLPPEVGDLVAVFDSAGGGSWRTARADSVASRADGAGCTPASGLLSAADSVARRPVTRLRLDRALPPSAGAGAPVRLLRRGRFVLTRGGDRSWSLAYRRCSGSPGCGNAQPVAGPLASASDSGLAFTLVEGEPRLEAMLRAPRREALTPGESRRLVITLRNRATGAP
ncbi:MAG TPA: hypothetical protein VJL28_14220 [Gemmatimonadaceae bacterium]|nr:hypothetical protein [Gemmatimonadaceae bacterium]